VPARPRPAYSSAGSGAKYTMAWIGSTVLHVLRAVRALGEVTR